MGVISKIKSFLTPKYINRAVAFLGAVAALCTGLIPVITNADWQSTTGIIAGLLVAAKFLDNWYRGWRQHEAMQYGREEQERAAVLLDTMARRRGQE